MDISTDYYALLGVDPQASTGAIKVAFKRLALQYHPDVYKGADAQERMRGLLQAYQVLSDPEARKAYDMQREHGDDSVTFVPGGSYTPKRKDRSEQGQYAFPDLNTRPLSAISFKLEKTLYQLSALQAEQLQLDGMLRGVRSGPADTTSAGGAYQCQRCGHRWSDSIAQSPPSTCPACHAQDWAEYLLLRCTHCQAVFASKEIHDPLRGNSLYYPYELFPLCPHCRRSQWCPAENQRITSLRLAANRRATLLWSSLIGVCVLVVALVAVFAFH
jgi:hypothetical protein